MTAQSPLTALLACGGLDLVVSAPGRLGDGQEGERDDDEQDAAGRPGPYTSSA
jgi:hypothetical protein